VTTAAILGVPDEVTAFPGIDRLGLHCRIAESVTVMRFGSLAAEQTGIVLGAEVSLYAQVRLVLGDVAQHPDTGIRIADRVIINVGSYLSGEGGLQIGTEVLIGPQVKILSAGHGMDDADQPHIWHNPLTYGKVQIADGAWIGAGAMVLPGVTIGRGAVVAAGAVVTRSVADFTVVAGIPARYIRHRQGFEPAESTRTGWQRWWRRLAAKASRP